VPVGECLRGESIRNGGALSGGGMDGGRLPAKMFVTNDDNRVAVIYEPSRALGVAGQGMRAEMMWLQGTSRRGTRKILGGCAVERKGRAHEKEDELMNMNRTEPDQTRPNRVLGTRRVSLVSFRSSRPIPVRHMCLLRVPASTYVMCWKKNSMLQWATRIDWLLAIRAEVWSL